MASPNVYLKDFIRLSLVSEAKYPAIREPAKGEPLDYRIHAWHSTSIDNWDGIKKKGLIPGAAPPSGQTWQGDFSGKAIYYHQMFPHHEVSESYDPDTGEPFILIIEVDFSIYSGLVVADEDMGSPDDTYEVMKQKGAIAVGFPCKPNNFVALHLIDTPEARDWAKEHAKGFNVQFHEA